MSIVTMAVCNGCTGTTRMANPATLPKGWSCGLGDDDLFRQLPRMHKDP